MVRKKRQRPGGHEQEDRSHRGSSGTLYVVSTPIGNLEDITLRALRVLKSVDFIAAEGVRHSKRLCTHYGIKTVLTRYNQHNHRVKTAQIIRHLKAGHDVALITNAGTPGISDPGSMLIREAKENGIGVSPVPGPSAVTAAVSVSGIKVDRFVFHGFLSGKAGRRRKELQAMADEARALVFFEAPHRIKATLEDILDVLGDRQVVLLKEMTKLHEKVQGGSVREMINRLNRESVKGEYTLVLAGRQERRSESPVTGEILGKMERLLREGDMSSREIAAKLARDEGMAYRRLYKACLDLKNAMELPAAPFLKNGVEKDADN
jgi:16S rRNA (cytidine1402-2'-O)-methyltransferase